jgi:hypothetical protein
MTFIVSYFFDKKFDEDNKIESFWFAFWRSRSFAILLCSNLS